MREEANMLTPAREGKKRRDWAQLKKKPESSAGYSWQRRKNKRGDHEFGIQSHSVGQVVIGDCSSANSMATHMIEKGEKKEGGQTNQLG